MASRDVVVRSTPPSSSSTRRFSPPSDSRRRRAAPPPAVAAADASTQSPQGHPVSAGRVQYSLPPLPSMNPNYPSHHSPYIPPQYAPLPAPAPVPPNGGPIPAMYPYGLPPHPYGHHPYGYHQYGPLGPGGFPPPRPPEAQPQPSPQPPPPPTPATPSSAKPLKRKRKPDDRNKSEEDTDAADLKKRTKTQRACDSCRSRKIRCDVLPDLDPPQCQHCKQYGFDCTFFLPITETRFKKKRLEEEAAAAAAAAAADKQDGPDDQRRSPKADASSKAETKVLGPTSPAYLLHSTATVPSRAYENYDLRYHHTWEVSMSGDSFIQVTAPALNDAASTVPRSVDFHIERDVVERLVNAYFNDVAPIFTIVTRDEFLSLASPPPVLLYAICSVAAASRDVSSTIFDNMRHAVSTVIKAEDVLSTTSTANLQALLILGMCGDCHSQYIPNALSAFWLRLGTAVRMAQDLGLHRAESVKQSLDLRRKLWAACVISDRWCSLAYGHPFMIDVEDCDVRLTSSEAVEDMYMNELLKLSIILGRVLKTIYSPSGLVLATDEGLEKLLADIDKWNESLPAALQFTGPESTQHAGLLHLFYTCVCMLFWRVFMRISYSVPTHLTFSLTVERWSGLVKLSREAIDWLDAHEKLYDVWMLVSYCATSCALVQYHTWARRQDAEAAATLRKLRDCIKRWEASLQPDHRSTRRKTAEIIALLYESTQTPLAAVLATSSSSEPSSTLPVSSSSKDAEPLNPTVGVRPRGKFPDGLTFRKDASQPGGGVFVVAAGDPRPGDGDYSNLPKGTIVVKGGVESSFVGQQGPTTQQQQQKESETIPPGVTSSELTGLSTATSGMATYTSSLSPTGGLPNVNPTLNGTSALIMQQYRRQQQNQQGQGQGQGFVSVQHVMDETTSSAINAAAKTTSGATSVGTTAASMLADHFAVAANGHGLLEGIPGSMFDYEKWDTYFARFALGGMEHQQGQQVLQQEQGHGHGQGQEQGRIQAQGESEIQQALAQVQAAGTLMGINQVQVQAQGEGQMQSQSQLSQPCQMQPQLQPQPQPQPQLQSQPQPQPQPQPQLHPQPQPQPPPRAVPQLRPQPHAQTLPQSKAQPPTPTHALPMSMSMSVPMPPQRALPQPSVQTLRTELGEGDMQQQQQQQQQSK